MTNGATIATTPPATAAELWTTGSLILIGVSIIVVLLAILWGARLKRARKSAERQIAADAQATPHPQPKSSIDAPPVAPAPPPLADSPVVATTPYETSPATTATDLASAPEPPAATPPPAATAPGDDDLTQLKGVGPRLAVRLGELGVTRYAQIADLSPAQADALDVELGAFRGRLARDRWIDQANYLARGDRDGFEAAFGKL